MIIILVVRGCKSVVLGYDNNSSGTWLQQHGGSSVWDKYCSNAVVVVVVV